MKLTDWTTVVPAPGAVKETARALLALARSPHDVRTAGTGTEFLVPPYLADLYNRAPSVPAQKIVVDTPPKPRRRTKKEGDE